MAFDPPLRRNKVRQAYSRQVRALGLEAFRRITSRTPVDTGNAKFNWHITTTSPSQAAQMQEGQVTSAVFENQLDDEAIQRGEPVFIQNNVPYIGALEYGHSRKNPAGMVRITLAELQTGLRLEAV